MYEVMLLNENGKKFSKTFNSEYLYRQFLNKAKKSKKVIILSHGRIN